MSVQVAKTKHHSSHSKPKSAGSIPVANVFDEEAKPHTPSHRPVVVEIEEVPDPTQTAATLPTPTEISIEPQPTVVVPQIPVPAQEQPKASEPVVEMVPPPVAPSTPPARSAVATPPEPVLPSFFEHDLKGGMVTHEEAPAVLDTAPVSDFPANVSPSPVLTADGVPPQAIVGELNELEEEEHRGGDKKKLIGILLIIFAVLLLAVGGFIVYAKRLSLPTTPEPTPMVTQPTPIPTSEVEATPAPDATQSGTVATNSAQLTDLKKKYKVDVLNGTKVAGLASKQAAALKAQGYTTGRVGNGDSDEAGTIVVPAGASALGKDIQRIFADFTFVLTEDAKAKTVIVTLGEPES